MRAEGASLIADHLTAKGVYLTNVVSALECEHAMPLYATIDALTTRFEHIWVYPCGEDDPTLRDNNVIVATNSTRQLSGAWEWPTAKELA
jgi:hypothetical protein